MLCALLFSVIAWGQERDTKISLCDCEINNISDIYVPDGDLHTVSFTLTYNDGVTTTTIDPSHYTSQLKYNNSVVTGYQYEGDYNLIVTAKEGDESYTGAISKNFYVVAENATLTLAAGVYSITSGRDWIVFSRYSEYWASTINLTADITIGSSRTKSNGVVVVTGNAPMIGNSTTNFTGTFNGGNHTITFYHTTSVNNGISIAPFQYTNGATFSNLTVAGAIVTLFDNAAGLIGINSINNSVATSVQNVTINAEVYNYNDDDSNSGACGGFAFNGTGVSFNNCVFKGRFASYNYGGGFCQTGDNITSLTNCLFDPVEGSSFYGDNFIYNVETDYSSCYYTSINNDLSTQGVLAYTSIPNNKIGHYGTNILGNNVYTPVEVTIAGFKDNYLCRTGVPLTIPYMVTYNNGTNAIGVVVNDPPYFYKGDDVEPTESIVETGDYRFVVTGKHDTETSGYHGTITKQFSVVFENIGYWTTLKEDLASTEGASLITLDKHYISGYNGEGAGALIINRDVTIDLNGYRIDRNLSSAETDGQVIIINSGKTVTIKDTSDDHKGLITGGYNKAANTTEHGGNNDGGGIRNFGNLTLQYVAISGNRCVKQNPGNPGTSATARGGGIYSGAGSTLTMSHVTVKDNNAQGGGGGIFAEDATVSISDCVVRSNVSLDKGGGIRLKNCGTDPNPATITDTEISYNELNNSGTNSVANGGGIHTEVGTVNLTRCAITQNISSKFGGGMFVLSGTVNALNCNISYNRCYDYDGLFNSRGGGVYIHSGSFKMNGGTITGNSSKMANGGGVFVNTIGSNNTAYFGIQGNVQIKDNWRFNENNEKDPTPTNVYIAGKNNVIHVEGDLDENAEIWVSKNGGSGTVTDGLNNHAGSPAQFKSDEGYTVNPAATEAGLSDPSTWNGTTMPGVTQPTSNNFTISKPVIVNTSISDVSSVSFEDDGCLILKAGGYLATNVIIDNSDDKKNNRVVVYGGELVPTSAIPAIVKKDIHWASDDSGDYWYVISSAVSEPNIVNKTNLITIDGYITIDGVDYPDDQYDLYRFNESVELQWENYRSTSIVHTGFDVNNPNSSLENGRGYLYRNENDYTVTYRGTINTGNIAYPLSYTSTVGGQDNPLVGFNLIGNPYTQKITLLNTTLVDNDGNQIKDGETPVNLTGFYKLSTTGSWSAKITSTSEKIDVGEGVLVQVPEAAKKVKFSQTPRAAKRANGDNIMFAIANSIYSDQTYALFENGLSLNKINHQNENIPMLYINHNDEDFAIATMNKDTKSFNLNFEAKTTGMFTLSCKAKGNFSYLHLYDRLTGNDVDMLLDGEYTFIASPTDNENRFLVVLDPLENLETLDGTFAYQNGNDIIVNGEGNLQIFDVMGRLIATQRINGVGTVNVSITGVYIFKLNEKTQKIVVR